ncbi:hypothetical protein SHKM778_66370 [Streptomyces sp. KM77-8]|uniref:Phosphatidic acid phosphatase type 2/haloperoxidase domain-containing protein n=1 Tax=Streptomyces haneummycinicus TaxID=3074435 RepID=A0AAT9HRJ8_9ACTN
MARRRYIPSGHTANAVVTWGILAYLASTPRARRWLSALSAVTSLGVGLSTVYIGTHWLSDVVLGWVAGLLILLALPWFEPLIARTEARIFDLRARRRLRRAGAAETGALARPVMLKPLTDRADPAPEPLATGRPSTRPPAYLASGSRMTRAERPGHPGGQPPPAAPGAPPARHDIGDPPLTAGVSPSRPAPPGRPAPRS